MYIYIYYTHIILLLHVGSISEFSSHMFPYIILSPSYNRIFILSHLLVLSMTRFRTKSARIGRSSTTRSARRPKVNEVSPGGLSRAILGQLG